MVATRDHTETTKISTAQAALPANGKNREKSGGEIAFNRGVYTVIGLGGNEVGTLLITEQFVHGDNLLEKAPGFLKRIGSWFSKEGYQGASEGLAKIFKTTKARAGNGLLMVTLLSGGTLLILPMKWLEDHKTYWVKKANHCIDWLRGNKLSKEEIERRDNEVEQAIACSPRQSWPSMMLGRVVACMASVGTGTFLVGKEWNDKIMDFSERVLAGSVQPKGQKNRWHRYASLIAVETYSCLISSSVLELASKLFAKRSMRVHDPELCKTTAAPQAEASSTGNTDTAYTDKIKAQKECLSCMRAM